MPDKIFVIVEGEVYEASPSAVPRDEISAAHEWCGVVGGTEVELLLTQEGPPRPAVSVILPTFNYGHRIEAMLESLEAQSFKDFELIVVDDGSTDKTVEALLPWVDRGFVDRLVMHGSNRGAAEAINTGAQLAQGKHWTWVSADNTMTPDWLEVLVGRMANPKCGVAYAQYDRFNDEGQQKGVWGKPYSPDALISDQNCYIGPAFLVRAKVWQETGPLRGKNSCDYDHWLRIEETCWRHGMNFQYVPQVLCHYYAGQERATVARRADYDAHHWQAEAKKRRNVVPA